MSAYRVQVVADGRRRTIQVEAADEWAAQDAAGRLVNARVTKRRRYAQSVSIGHAIPVGSTACAYGCCALR